MNFCAGDLMFQSAASTSQIREDVNRELVLKTEQLTEENAILHQEVAALQQRLSETNLRVSSKELIALIELTTRRRRQECRRHLFHYV